MFSPSDFGSPTQSAPPASNNRVVGMLLLFFCILMCAGFSLAMDATVLNGFSATYAVTQTYQAAHPQSTQPVKATPTSRFIRPTRVPFGETPTALPGEEQANLVVK